MTLITQVRTKNFVALIGDGRIQKADRNPPISDNNQKVFFTANKKYLIGYCGSVRYEDASNETPVLLNSFATTHTPVNMDECIDNLKNYFEPKMQGEPKPDYNLSAIDFIICDNIESVLSYIGVRRIYDRDYNVSKDYNYRSKNKNHEIEFIPEHLNFTSELQAHCKRNQIKLEEEGNLNKLFDLFISFYKDVVYNSPKNKSSDHPNQPIGGRVTVLILKDGEVHFNQVE